MVFTCFIGDDLMLNAVKNGANAHIKANAPRDAKNRKNMQKMERTPRGALIYLFLLKNAAGTLQTPRGVLFRAFSRGRPRGASLRYEKVFEKGLLPKRKGTFRSIQWVE